MRIQTTISPIGRMHKTGKYSQSERTAYFRPESDTWKSYCRLFRNIWFPDMSHDDFYDATVNMQLSFDRIRTSLQWMVVVHCKRLTDQNGVYTIYIVYVYT